MKDSTANKIIDSFGQTEYKKGYSLAKSETLKEVFKEMEKFIESKRVFDKGKCFEGFVDLDEIKELTQKLKELETKK